MGKKRLARTTVLSVCLGSFLVGLALALRMPLTLGWLWRALILCILPLLCRKYTLSLLSIIGLCLLVGWWRGTVFAAPLLPYSSLAKQSITIVATASSDAVYGDKKQLEFDVGNIQVKQPHHVWLPGTIGVKGYGAPMVYRGDSVQVTAKLYPAKGSRLGRLSFARIEVLRKDSSLVNTVRRRFGAGLQSVLPEPLGAIGLGLLIGQRTTLPDSLNQSLSIVGLTHIVAVSGYNLTIMVGAIHHFGRQRSNFQRTCVTLLFIGLFITITGSSASMVRAGWVSILSLWASYYGRRFKPHLLILLVAATTAGWYPVYLWRDDGWHLSFLAFTGVLVVAPMLAQRFFNRPPRMLGQLVLETMAAQIMTLPLIMLVFGKLSLIALIANLMVVPLVPIAMLLCFIAGVASLLVPMLAGWFAWPAALVLRYLVDVVQLLARLPWASVGRSIGVWQLIGCYTLIFILLVMWWQKRPKNGMIQEVNKSTSPIPATQYTGTNEQE